MLSPAMTAENMDENDPDFQAFQQKMQKKDQAKQIKEEKISADRKAVLLLRRRKWRLQMKRTQMYLGLIDFPSILKGEKNVDNPSLPEDPAHQGLGNPLNYLASDSYLESNNPLTSGTLTSHSSTIFVCVDLEAYEFNQQQITEIGVSTLHSYDLLGLDPGKNGKAWAKKIHSRHFRIKEYARRRNKVHVESSPDNFNFGESEWISKKDAALTMKGIFAKPPPSFTDPAMDAKQGPKFVLVAHNADADITYLEKLGYNPAEDIVDIIDTSDLANTSDRDTKQTSLSALLLRHGIAAKHLHNAGNDAHYTLQVMLALAVNNFQNKLSAEEWASEKTRRIKAAGEEAKAKAEAKAALDMEGWSTSENDDVPSSALVPIREQRFKTVMEPGLRSGDGGRTDRGGREGRRGIGGGEERPGGGGRRGRRGKEGGEERGGGGVGGKGGNATPKSFVIARRQDYQSNSRGSHLPSSLTLPRVRPSPGFELQHSETIGPGVDGATYTAPLDLPAVSGVRPPPSFWPTGFNHQPGGAEVNYTQQSDQIHPQPPNFYQPSNFYPPPPDPGRGYNTRPGHTDFVQPIWDENQERRRGGAGIGVDADSGDGEGGEGKGWVLEKPFNELW